MKKRIVLDPGHGGEDPGTSYKGITEAYANFSIALTLKWLLVQNGYKVYLTRYGNYRPSYRERTDLAKKVHADAFVSIHFDMPKGTRLVFYSAEKLNLLSKELATYIAQELKTNKVLPSTVSRFGRLYIDDVPNKIPSVLVEVDPINKFQNTKSYRLDRATKIFNGIQKFFEENE